MARKDCFIIRKKEILDRADITNLSPHIIEKYHHCKKPSNKNVKFKGTPVSTTDDILKYKSKLEGTWQAMLFLYYHTFHIHNVFLFLSTTLKIYSICKQLLSFLTTFKLIPIFFFHKISSYS